MIQTIIFNIKYLFRYILLNYSNIDDYKKFPFNKINNSKPIYNFDVKNNSSVLSLPIQYQYKGTLLSNSLESLLNTTGTTSFIIIKDDVIVCEKYLNNYTKDSINTSFSVAKSITSILIRLAIDEGKINSVDDSMIEYIPELKGKVDNTLSIKHLLAMNSGIKYSTNYFPWSDEPLSYYYPDLRKLILKRVKQEYQPGLYFKYTNYNYILLGMILERATKISPSEYLEEKIWKRLGMEFEASWSTDNKIAKLTKMESGINAHSIDFAKFGQLILKNGKWDGLQVIPEKWISESVSPFMANDTYYKTKNYYPYSMFFNDKRLYYKYGWWGITLDSKNFDFMAMGNLGQFIYISPSKNMVIVRNGKSWGNLSWWPSVFISIAERI